MNDIFQIAGVGLLQARERLEGIGTNAASASLTGYRRQVTTAASFDALLEPDATADVPMPPMSTRVDLRAAGITATGRALDVAIEGDDLFFGLTDGTRTWLTRAGAFELNSAGALVGERGLSVLGTQGELQLPGSDVAVAADGTITRQGIVVGALQLFRPLDKTSLHPAGGALLSAPEGFVPAESDNNRVRPGALEGSNTDAAQEMIDLVALSRQFESLSRVVQTYDDMLGRTIQKLGDL